MQFKHKVTKFILLVVETRSQAVSPIMRYVRGIFKYHYCYCISSELRIDSCRLNREHRQQCFLLQSVARSSGGCHFLCVVKITTFISRSRETILEHRKRKRRTFSTNSTTEIHHDSCDSWFIFKKNLKENYRPISVNMRARNFLIWCGVTSCPKKTFIN